MTKPGVLILKPDGYHLVLDVPRRLPALAATLIVAYLSEAQVIDVEVDDRD